MLARWKGTRGWHGQCIQGTASTAPSELNDERWGDLEGPDVMYPDGFPVGEPASVHHIRLQVRIVLETALFCPRGVFCCSFSAKAPALPLRSLTHQPRRTVG
jgi:hypothetical protein